MLQLMSVRPMLRAQVNAIATAGIQRRVSFVQVGKITAISDCNAIWLNNVFLFVLFGLLLYVPVNSYGHVKRSVHQTTLFLGQAWLSG